MTTKALIICKFYYAQLLAQFFTKMQLVDELSSNPKVFGEIDGVIAFESENLALTKILMGKTCMCQIFRPLSNNIVSFPKNLQIWAQLVD